MTTFVKLCATPQQQLYDRAANISLKLNVRDGDRPMVKLLSLGGARFTYSVILRRLHCYDKSNEILRRIRYYIKRNKTLREIK
jgi:hypothetical protein